jgi:hypothetical protein
MMLHRAQEIVPVIGKIKALDPGVRFWHLAFGQPAEADRKKCLTSQPGRASLEVDPRTLNRLCTEHKGDDGRLLKLVPYALQPDLSGKDLPVIGRQENAVGHQPLEVVLNKVLDRLRYAMFFMYEANEYARHVFLVYPAAKCCVTPSP